MYNGNSLIDTDYYDNEMDFGEEKKQILFKVEHFKINGEWACAMVSPLKNNVEIINSKDEKILDKYHSIIK